jgi:ATP-dependent DNA helicase RecG
MIISSLVQKPLGKIEIARAIGHQSVSGELKKQILWLNEHDLIEHTLPEKPNSRLQKYRLTEKGRRMIYEG